MRTIKFRGKAKAGQEYLGITPNKWVYGSLLVDELVKTVFIENTKNEDILTIEVYPETVGQFIGLKDKNGKEIYEWDIVKMHQFLFDGSEHENEILGIVVYNKDTMCFCLTKMENKQIQEYMGYEDEEEFKQEIQPICMFYGLHDESWEVIGNAFDNPELLGDKQ